MLSCIIRLFISVNPKYIIIINLISVWPYFGHTLIKSILLLKQLFNPQQINH